MKRAKNIAPLIMLCAGAVTALLGLIYKLPFGDFLRNLAIALVVFYILGCVVQEIVERNFKEEEQEAKEGVSEEGESEETGEGEETDRSVEENLNTDTPEN